MAAVPVAPGADDGDVEAGVGGCGGVGWGSHRSVVLWGRDEKGFVDFRLMPRCAGLVGA